MRAAETLTDHVSTYLESNGCMQQAQDVQALHRLDKDTTGIVFFSLDKETQPLFDELIRSRNVHKIYLAVVKGEFPEGEQDITLPIGRDRHDARRMRVSKTGKTALTHVRRLEVQRRGQSTQSLMLAELGTGRKHQIRVHFSALGFPIVGDGLYGPIARDSMYGRASSTRTAAFTQVSLMLHAYELSFVHPVTGEPLVLKTEWPARFTGWSVQNP